MNIGQTGLYFDEWWFLFLALVTGLYFSFLFQVYKRTRSNVPRRRFTVCVALTVVSVFVVFFLVVAFHDLAFAGQNYEREFEVTCSSPVPLLSNRTKAFVVAKYKENTTWLQCPEYAHVDSVVYEKSSVPREDTAHHVYMENVGYECPAYMRYILDHYDNLPDQVYFVHGNPYEHCAGFANAVTAVEPEDFYIFSVWNWRFYRSGWPHYWPHQGFAAVMDRMYAELFDREPPAQLQTYFNGQFMASRSAILRHPPEFYRKILELTTTRRDRSAYSWGSKGDGWLECCAMERLWQKVFTGQDEYPAYPPERTYC